MVALCVMVGVIECDRVTLRVPERVGVGGGVALSECDLLAVCVHVLECVPVIELVCVPDSVPVIDLLADCVRVLECVAVNELVSEPVIEAVDVGSGVAGTTTDTLRVDTPTIDPFCRSVAAATDRPSVS